MDRAERYFRDALSRRADYGEAANNLALVLVSRGQADAAVSLLEDVSEAERPRTRRPTSRWPRSTSASADQQGGCRGRSSGCCSGTRRTRSRWNCSAVARVIDRLDFQAARFRPLTYRAHAGLV